MNCPEFCETCKGHTRLVENYQPYHKSEHRGQPWTGTYSETHEARMGLTHPVECPDCNGTGFQS